MTKALKTALKKQKKSTKREILQITGTLGIPIGGQKTVEVPNRNSFVYVKLRDNQSEVIQAFNNKVAPSYGLPVIVERQSNRYVVVNVDTLRYQNNWNSFAPFLPRHGNTHSFDFSMGGGGDIVWVHSRQFMPSLIMPSGSSGGPNVLVNSYTLKNADGTWRYTGNTGTTNLTLYNPSTGTQAVMALVYLDALSGNPYFMVGSGSYFPSNITGTAEVLPYVPTLTNPNHIPLGAVRLVTGTGAISWDNIYDLRQFLHPVPTGTGGGGAATMFVQDEGIPLGSVGTLNFVGNGVDVSISGSVARIHITGSTGGGVANLTGTFVGTPNSIVLTNTSGFLTTQANLQWSASSSGYLRYGANIPNQHVLGNSIGYDITQDSGYFEIIGSITGTGGLRSTRIIDNLLVDNTIEATTYKFTNNLNMWPYVNSAGIVSLPTSAPLNSIITGTFQVLGLTDADVSSRFTLGSITSDYLNYVLTPATGWIPRDEAWTRTGNHTFTVPGDLTAIYRKGTRVTYHDGALEYGVVASSSFAGSTTTVNLIPNTDYNMAATFINDRYVSYIENPEGFPSAFNFSTVPAATSGGFGANYTINSATWTPMGKQIKVNFDFTITNNGTGASAIIVPTPVTAATYSTGDGREKAITGAMLQLEWVSGGTSIRIKTYADAYPGGTNYQPAGSIINAY